MIPALIGAFAGAPVLARELESGTFRYAWTQGFGRTRWAVAKLVLLAVAVTAAAGAFSVLVSWYIQPLFGAGDNNGPLYPTIFDLRGVALAAWTLAAFAIGVLAGILIRRVIPAMFATFAVYAGLAFVTGAFLRRHYATPLVSRDPNFNGRAWMISQLWTRGGKPGQPGRRSTRHSPDRHPGVDIGCGNLVRDSASIDPVRYLVQHGYTQLTTYQPAAGSGRSSGSRAAGCSRCRCCSSARPSGWSAAARPEPPAGSAAAAAAPRQFVRRHR